MPYITNPVEHSNEYTLYINEIKFLNAYIYSIIEKGFFYFNGNDLKKITLLHWNFKYYIQYYIFRILGR